MSEKVSKAEEDRALFSLELFIAKFLRYGVLLAGVLIFIGWMTQISFTADAFAPYTVYRNVPLSSVLSQAWVNHTWGLLTCYFGLGVLISLPLLRVFLTAAVFVFEKDYILAACAALVLFGLCLSFAIGALI